MKKLLLALTIVSLAFLSFGQDNQQKPNIIFILADDLGYGSINAYGAGKNLLRTPALDRLAEEGMRFTDASTPASICSPTRIGFLTGMYPWRTSLKFGVVNPNDPLILDPDTRTIADVLQDQGYQTAAIGKWHLGYGDKKPVDHAAKLTPGPLDLGFDYHFGVPQNHGDMWGVYVENDEVYGLRSKDIYPFSRNYYRTRYIGIDAPQRVNKDVTAELAEKAVDWIKKQDKEKPFFLYFAAVAVHRPITPSDGMRGISDCGPYGDFIQDLDQSVDRILEGVDYLGLADNAIVIFTSDNGGQFNLNEDDAPETFAIQKGLRLNGDLRGDKHTIWEGGTRVPFIVKWPGMVAPGTVSDDLVNVVDVFATVAEIVDGIIPEPDVAAPDSFSFLPSLLTKKGKTQRAYMITADANGMQAIRYGDWKYIDDTPPEGLPQNRQENMSKSFKPQLYNLADDPAEKVNLYDEKHEKVKQLKEQLIKIRESGSSR
jgi:arylsulfatase A-like enzyme